MSSPPGRRSRDARECPCTARRASDIHFRTTSRSSASISRHRAPHEPAPPARCTRQPRQAGFLQTAWSSLPLLLLGLFALSQNITVHPAAIEMKERHLRIVPQRSGGKAALELAQHILGHIVQVGEWLRADLDPDELD